jgi:hypothetical protein
MKTELRKDIVYYSTSIPVWFLERRCDLQAASANKLISIDDKQVPLIARDPNYLLCILTVDT